MVTIIDPGLPLDQQRKLRPGVDPAGYIESGIRDGKFLRASGEQTNDIYLPISSDELMPLVLTRVLGSVRQWLLDYRDQRCAGATTTPCFPEAAASDDGVCQPGNHDGWLAVRAGDCVDSLFTGLQFESVQRELHWFIKNQWWKFIRYKVATECQGEAAMTCNVQAGQVDVDGVVYPGIEIRPETQSMETGSIGFFGSKPCSCLVVQGKLFPAA